MYGKLRINQPDGSYERYYGRIDNNMANGKGTARNRTYQYDGEFKNNKKHGKGYYFDDFYTSYDGQWKEDNYHGFGVLRCIYGGPCYKGEWKDGKMNGFGKYFYPQSGPHDEYDSNEYVYIGEWKNDMRHGFGSFLAKTHLDVPIYKYVGLWVNDKKEGLFQYIKYDLIHSTKDDAIESKNKTVIFKNDEIV